MTKADGAMVCGDWGGSRLRLWLLRHGRVMARAEGPGLFTASAPADRTLSDALGRLAGTDGADRIVLCGMAGAREGLAETAYVPCPGTLEEWSAQAVEGTHRGRPVTIMPGFATRDAGGRPDVMRGEETQVFGALASSGIDSALAILPGTHSKWVRVENGRIEDFLTCPTGELRGCLLGSSLAPATAGRDDSGDEGFAAGLDRTASGAELLPALFEARSGQLCDAKSGSWARGFVSGVLIGSEIRAMESCFSADLPCLLIGDATLARNYERALSLSGRKSTVLDDETCVLEGLRLAHAHIG